MNKDVEEIEDLDDLIEESLDERDTNPRSPKKLKAIALCIIIFTCAVICTALLVILLNS